MTPHPSLRLNVIATVAACLTVGVTAAAAAAGQSSGPPVAASTTPGSQIVVHAPAGHLPHLFRQQPTDRQKMGQPVTPAAATPLTYKAGGLVMAGPVKAYLIFWQPPKLQDGRKVAPIAGYNALITRYFSDVGGHSIYTNDTQYYETLGSTTTYIQNASSLGGTYTDVSPYPAADCSDPAYPAKDCISDAVIQSEVKKVATAKGWPTGLGAEYFVYATTGEGSCQSKGAKTAADCFAPGGYCAYHSFIAGTNAGTSYIYGNMPYDGDAATGCGLLGSGGTPVSPNKNIPADVEMSVTSHEQMESVTDPFPGTNVWGWHDSSGAEIGDKCAGTPGPGPYWLNNTATQMWNGHFYALQSEFDNHALGCVQVGP